ncbi:hypothetical protein Raf01_43540 [Rugosimonospora africana]|uniref:Lipoprotein n=1 Tax=Rugosimonospora africana TaxID=556532 RepID=A0A8J3VRJ0_9ACTN|nr:hypothetical protein Raf01_43540 [Rugosimonospora africana]
MIQVVVLAGLASIAGCSTGSPPAAATSTTAIPAAAGTTAALTTGGKVHLTAYTDNDGPTATVILAGAVGDYGKAQSVNPDGSVNTEHSSQFNLALTRGSFRLDIAALDKEFVAVLGNLAVNTTTCSGTASVHGTVPVVAGSGTGAYRGIGGTFDLTFTLDEVYRTNACSESGAYLSQSIVIAGPGSVSFGATGS